LIKSLYQTVNKHSEHEISKIKWSRFIWNIFHITNKEEADKYIHDIIQKYPDATHHCFAYRYEIHMNFDIFGTPVYTSKHNKTFDDGEPTNTAGKPIMSMIEKYTLHNVLIVITRYFGGTLLGVGGLIQAYMESAKQVIEHANIEEHEITKIIICTYRFDLVHIVRNLINKYDGKIIHEICDKEITSEIRINIWYIETFKKELLENSKGQIAI